MSAIGHLINGSCAETARELSAYAEDELSRLRRLRVSRHLARCERCRAVLQALLATLEALRRVGTIEPAPQPELAERVVDRIRAAEGT